MAAIDRASWQKARRLRLLLVGMEGAIIVVFTAILAAFWYFQVSQHAQLLERAENNHQRRLHVRAARGVVFDRDGRVLVENRHALNISLIRENVEDLGGSINRLARVTGVEEAALHAVVDRHRREPSSRPVVVIPNATLAQVASVAARKLELPGVIVEQTPARHYPAERLAAHSFGYVGEITDEQLLLARYDGLRQGAIIGHAGIEHTYNHLLMGTDGARHIVVDSVGREIGTLSEERPVEGARLRLTIDYDLQEAAEEAFRAAGFNGAAVVLDPRTGDVLSLVSLPAYNPNAFATGIDGETWEALNDEQRRPLYNRALQGRYSPGSTFKIAMAVAALEEGVVDPEDRVVCRGGGAFHGRFYRCHSSHGSVALEEALEKSCNTYFYTLGTQLDVDQIHKWATALGLGELSRVDLPHEVQGLVPSRQWKQEAVGERWYAGETLSVAIGQGQVSVTPISLAVMMVTVANGGWRITPRLLDAYDEGGGWQPAPLSATASLVRMSPETVETVTRGLWNVVNRQGTGGRARIRGRHVMGKTGTAQVISLEGLSAAETDRDLRDHGWFVFAAPAGDPRIAGVVFGEHAEHGYLTASVARHVMETFFAKEDGLPPPLLEPVPSPPPSAAPRARPAPERLADPRPDPALAVTGTADGAGGAQP